MELFWLQLKKGSTDSSVSINYSNNFSFSRPANMPHKASPMQTVQAYKDMGWVNYRTGENVDTWLGLLEDYVQNPGNYPEGYTTIDGLRYQLKKQTYLMICLKQASNRLIMFL